MIIATQKSDRKSFPLGEIVQPIRPRVKPSEKPDLPFIGMDNVEAQSMKLLGTVPAGTMKSSAVHFQPGDVLYGRLRPYLNKVYRPNFEGLCSAEFIVLPENELVDGKYLQYFLNSAQFVSYASHLNEGDRPRVNFKQLSNYPVPLPATIDEQRGIVADIEKQFSRLDEAVISLKRAKANLKRYKAAVLKAAVEGKLTEEWRKQHPDVEPASELLKRILAERRRKWEEGELTKKLSKFAKPRTDRWKQQYREPRRAQVGTLATLPETWTWGSIEQIAEVQLGKMLDKRKHRVGKPLPYLRNVNVQWRKISTSDLYEMYFKENEIEKYSVASGDVLVCEGGEPGRAAVWNGRTPEIKYQKAIHRVRIFGAYLPEFLVTYLEYLASDGRLNSWFTGSTIKHFTRESFMKLPIPIPPMDEQAQIVKALDSYFSSITDTDRTIEANQVRGRRFRQAILSEAFRGKVS